MPCFVQSQRGKGGNLSWKWVLALLKGLKACLGGRV
ncbi:hypothetical protein AVEN_28524-1, partial [Araneus ventricosus]